MKKKDDYKLYKYLNSKGEFDYEKYRKIQVEGNKKKINKVFVKEENIKYLSNYLKKNMGNIKFGLCHGTRRGLEQKWFKKYLGCTVLGTEISETSNDFENTIQWDFHEIKDEWLNSVDFIYSNSFDHSYDPKKCLNQWMKCVKPGGVCILEYTKYHSKKHTSMLDPFGIELEELLNLITKWGKGKYKVTQLLKDAPVKNSGQLYIVIHKL